MVEDATFTDTAKIPTPAFRMTMQSLATTVLGTQPPATPIPSPSLPMTSQRVATTRLVAPASRRDQSGASPLQAKFTSL
jgi:hypothetical protein